MMQWNSPALRSVELKTVQQNTRHRKCVRFGLPTGGVWRTSRQTEAASSITVHQSTLCRKCVPSVLAIVPFAAYAGSPDPGGTGSLVMHTYEFRRNSAFMFYDSRVVDHDSQNEPRLRTCVVCGLNSENFASTPTTSKFKFVACMSIAGK